MSTLAAFRGRPIDKMTRGELIEALEWCAAEIKRHYEPDAMRARAVGRAKLFVEKCREDADTNQ